MSRAVRWAAGLTLGLGLLSAVEGDVSAQGCVCTRQNIPVIGSTEGAYKGGSKWQVFAGFRYFKSHRHFVGKEEQVHRETEQSEVINWMRVLDFGATYSFSERFSLTVDVPLVFADRSNPIRDANREVIDRFQTNAYGFGDVSVTARGWVLDPNKHPDYNIGVGLGVKLPTGDSGATDTFQTSNGPEIRTVDQSIQPGDGGLGLLLAAQGFKRFGKFTFSGAGSYLFNPRNTTDVPTFRRRPQDAFMSVADQYVARLGVAYPLLPERGLAVSFAGRWEGVPARDLIGGSDGFRRPGYSVSLEPGFSLSSGTHSFGFSIPFAVSRNRTRSVSDIIVGGHGDAAFADFQIITNYVYRF